VIAPGAIDFEGPSAPEASDLAQWVRQELAGLPYYGVFDLLAFEVSDLGVVTLGGYVAHRPLKLEAEKGVTRVEGVAGVVNRIEVLPVSSGDDDLRRACTGLSIALPPSPTTERAWTDSRPRAPATRAGVTTTAAAPPCAIHGGPPRRSRGWSRWETTRSTSS
jgi:hypothetical protein